MFAHQPEMKVFSGTANRELAERICRYIGIPLGRATISSFPDGETYVMIEENVRGRDVFLIQPTSPPSNEHLMELLIMVDAARRASADRITAVIAFFGYARPDRKEKPRVSITAAELVKKTGAKKIYAGVSHAVLVDVAIPRLQKSKIEELITTNSTPVRPVEGFKTTVLCVSELLGEGIKRIHNDESVSSLFKIDK